MTDRLDELLKRQFAREEAARKQPTEKTMEEVLAESRRVSKEADLVVARYNATKNSTSGSIIEAAASGALSMVAFASFLALCFIIFTICLLALNFLGVI